MGDAALKPVLVILKVHFCSPLELLLQLLHSGVHLALGLPHGLQLLPQHLLLPGQLVQFGDEVVFHNVESVSVGGRENQEVRRRARTKRVLEVSPPLTWSPGAVCSRPADSPPPCPSLEQPRLKLPHSPEIIAFQNTLKPGILWLLGGDFCLFRPASVSPCCGTAASLTSTTGEKRSARVNKAAWPG